MSKFLGNKWLGVFIIFCSVIAFYILFHNLGKFPLENWDEAWYGEATREMMKGHNLIALYWDRMLWLDKPPLQIWINSIISSILGISELSIRLLSALSAFIIVLGVAIHSYKRFGLVPAVLAFGTLILNNVFVWRSRSGNLDLLASVLVLATYFLVLSKNKYKYPLLGLTFAAIFLCKASLVMLPLSIFFLHEIFFERNNIKANLNEYIKLAVLFFTPVALWLGLGYLDQGWKFVNYYLFNSDQGVASATGFNPNYIWYVYYALQRRFFYLFLIGVFFLIFRIKKRENFLLLFYSLLLVIQLSLTARSNNWYLLPAMPFWSLTIAYGLRNLLDIFRNNKIVIIGVLAITAYIFFKTYTVNILPVLNSSSTIDQSQSGKAIARLSKPGDVIVRLDTLCPTTVFYADRRVLCSVPAVDKSGNYWISRKDFIAKIEKGELRWVVGSKSDVENFKNDSRVDLKVIYSNESESIGELR